MRENHFSLSLWLKIFESCILFLLCTKLICGKLSLSWPFKSTVENWKKDTRPILPMHMSFRSLSQILVKKSRGILWQKMVTLRHQRLHIPWFSVACFPLHAMFTPHLFQAYLQTASFLPLFSVLWGWSPSEKLIYTIIESNWRILCLWDPSVIFSKGNYLCWNTHGFPLQQSPFFYRMLYHV